MKVMPVERLAADAHVEGSRTTDSSLMIWMEALGRLTSRRPRRNAARWALRSFLAVVASLPPLIILMMMQRAGHVGCR